MSTPFALGEHFDAFIESEVRNGRFKDASDVVREALRLLEDRQVEAQAKTDALRAEIQKGLEGPFYPAEEVFDRIRDKIQAVAKKKAAG